MGHGTLVRHNPIKQGKILGRVDSVHGGRGRKNRASARKDCLDDSTELEERWRWEDRRAGGLGKDEKLRRTEYRGYPAVVISLGSGRCGSLNSLRKWVSAPMVDRRLNVPCSWRARL